MAEIDDLLYFCIGRFPAMEYGNVTKHEKSPALIPAPFRNLPVTWCIVPDRYPHNIPFGI
jgi:hypothetical protein